MEWKISSLKDLEHYFWRCTACGTCRSAYDFGPPPFTRPICPAGIFASTSSLADAGASFSAHSIVRSPRRIRTFST